MDADIYVDANGDTDMDVDIDIDTMCRTVSLGNCTLKEWVLGLDDNKYILQEIRGRYYLTSELDCVIVSGYKGYSELIRNTHRVYLRNLDIVDTVKSIIGDFTFLIGETVGWRRSQSSITVPDLYISESCSVEMNGIKQSVFMYDLVSFARANSTQLALFRPVVKSLDTLCKGLQNVQITQKGRTRSIQESRRSIRKRFPHLFSRPFLKLSNGSSNCVSRVQ
ncbi:hypothetical protein EB118_07285 [bacterium]|nr:hypothetical protein [bacterium]NDC94456.1 hypothetical protein [bacterium]NDD84029.1 hypothetical protein [bacterium]NDG29885.1 hypothetical protein [bacterium]